MKIVKVRELLKHTPLETQQGAEGNYNVRYEDGEVISMDAKLLVINRYFWEILKPYTNFSIISAYEVSKYYTSGLYTGGTHGSYLTRVTEDLIKLYFIPNNMDVQECLNTLFYSMFNLIELLYSELSYNISSSVMTMSITDLLSIQLNPELSEAMKQVEEDPNVKSIDKAYAVLDDIIRNNPEYADNTVAKAYISGMVNINQMKQVLGPRGYVTELDSSIFKYPIANSYTTGLRDLYEVASESRSGAKALFLSSVAIEKSEYFARELQLACMVVTTLSFTDCGSRDYVDWYVKEPEIDNGNVIYRGDLPNLVGKYYLDEDTGEERMITKNDTHLYGKTIKRRSVSTCKLKNKTHVCSRCFGELAYNVTKHTNLGHLCSTELSAIISQSILSTKHLTASATTKDIVLDKIASRFFMVKSSNAYAFKPNVTNKKGVTIKLMISQNECFGIKDIRKDKSIMNINPARVTKIESMVVITEIKGKVEYFPIKVKVGNRYGVLELKFLKYILETGYIADENNNYIFDVSKWKLVSPILSLPEVEYSFVALSGEIKKIFKSVRILTGGVSKDTYDSMLSKLFTLVNSKLSINLAILEVIVYAFTVYDLPNGDYSLGRFSKRSDVVGLLDLITSRSLGAAYGYEYTTALITNPSSFFGEHRVNHPLDVLITPNEVIADKKRKYYIKA